MFNLSEEPEVQTVAITNKRGSGKSLTLAWAGYCYKERDIPVSSNMGGMGWWAAYQPDPVLMFSQPGVLLGDEFYVPADRRASMTWDVRDLGYLMAQGRKPGKGKYPNITFVALPWNLQKLGAVDIRIEPFFDWEWMPVLYREQDMLVVYREKIEDGRRTKHEPLIIPFPLTRGYGNLFDTYEKIIPPRMRRHLEKTGSNTLEAYNA